MLKKLTKLKFSIARDGERLDNGREEGENDKGFANKGVDHGDVAIG